MFSVSSVTSVLPDNLIVNPIESILKIKVFTTSFKPLLSTILWVYNQNNGTLSVQ